MQITVSADRHGAPVSEKLYGIFLEDINYGCDGGLYAELIANRCFENVDSAGIPHRLMHWTPLGGAMLAIRTQAPRGEKNPHYLRMTSEATASWGCLLYTSPMIALYPFLQKYFVKGVMIGSLKG